MCGLNTWDMQLTHHQQIVGLARRFCDLRGGCGPAVPSGLSKSGTITVTMSDGKLFVVLGEQRSGRRLSTAGTLWPLSNSSFGTRGLPAWTKERLTWLIEALQGGSDGNECCHEEKKTRAMQKTNHWKFLHYHVRDHNGVTFYSLPGKESPWLYSCLLAPWPHSGRPYLPHRFGAAVSQGVCMIALKQEVRVDSWIEFCNHETNV